MCTISPSQVAKLAADLRAIRPDVMLVDAPVSGGTPRAASGDLTILCAGLDFSVPSATSAHAVLRALSGSQGNDANLILIPGGVGKGAAIKLINQHLAGESPLVHLQAQRVRLIVTSRLSHSQRRRVHHTSREIEAPTAPLPGDYAYWPGIYLDDGSSRRQHA